MIRSTLLAACVCALAAPAQASDPRLASRLYNPDEVVRIEGRTGVQASIAFADGEHIENVAVGDSASWQITPNKRANQLFVKPLAARARTNMTVVTDRRTYLFDLVASPAGKAIYVLRFTYPDEPRTEAPAQASDTLTGEEQLALSRTPVDPAALNFAWRVRGAPALLPARIYDDGAATYVSWAAGSPVPAILVRDERGTEGPVNFAVRGDVIVIDGVPELIVLRSGRNSATLEKQAENRGPVAATPPAALAAVTATQPQEQ